MELRNKMINIMGDSITEGVGVSESSKRYTDVFARLTGATVNNYGISGTRIARQITPTLDAPTFDLDFMSRVKDMDIHADAVVVFGGTNDFGHGDAPMGTMDSRDPYTFYGACHILMTDIMERFCGKPIVFMTPLKRLYGDETSIYETKKGYTLEQYVKAIKEVAGFYSIPVLDLYSISGFAPQIPKIREALTTDGLHPTDMGAQIIAERLKGFMESL